MVRGFACHADEKSSFISPRIWRGNGYEIIKSPSPRVGANEVFLLAIEKYRVHEVAKDFGLPTKTITEILTRYVAAPKNHMQVLTDHE